MNNFQKYLSYVSRIVVEKTRSQHNQELIVAIQDGKYVLNTKNANYSYASLHRVFQQALSKIKIQQKNIETILVLGGGAGSIPSIIYNELNLTPKMDAIEIDAKVIELGNRYFGLSQFSHLNVVIDDANNFVNTTTNQYDLILVDLFMGINVPEEFLSQRFFEQLKKLLNKDGEILINYVAYNYDTKKRVKSLEESLTKTYSYLKTFRFEDINRVFYLKA